MVQHGARCRRVRLLGNLIRAAGIDSPASADGGRLEFARLRAATSRLRGKIDLALAVLWEPIFEACDNGRSAVAS